MQGHEGRTGKKDPGGTTRDHGGLQGTNRTCREPREGIQRQFSAENLRRICGEPVRSSEYNVVLGAGGGARTSPPEPASSRNDKIPRRPQRTCRESCAESLQRICWNILRGAARRIWRTTGGTWATGETCKATRGAPGRWPRWDYEGPWRPAGDHPDLPRTTRGKPAAILCKKSAENLRGTRAV